MNDEDRQPREFIAEAIMRTATAENGLDGNMMLGFVTIVEWLAPDGQRWLSFLSGDPDGRGLPDWTAEGYMHNALIGDLPPWVHGAPDGDDDSDTDAL